MADKGTVGARVTQPGLIVGPRDRLRYGALSISGTAQLNETPAPAVVWVCGARGVFPMLAVQAAADGSFVAYNLAAGRYIVIVHGQQEYLPGVHAVDVS